MFEQPQQPALHLPPVCQTIRINSSGPKPSATVCVVARRETVTWPFVGGTTLAAIVGAVHNVILTVLLVVGLFHVLT